MAAFKLASAAAAVAVVAFIGWTAFRIGGDPAAIAVDDIGEAVAAFVALTCCVVAYRRTQDRERLGWLLLAASAASWGAGEVVWSVYEVGLGLSVPVPSPADVGFLAAIPLAAAGIVMFFTPARGTSQRLRLWLDGAIVFLAFLYISWAIGLGAIYHSPGEGPLAKAVELAYPIGDIVIGTILILAIRRATNAALGRLLLLLGGLAAISVSDSAFVYLTSNSAFGAGSVLDAGWVAGYLMIALAGLWPSSPAQTSAQRELLINTWQLVLPWLPVLAAGTTAIVISVRGDISRPILTAIAGGVAILLMVSQVYSHGESLTLLRKVRRDAATLNDIILYAPLGVVRIGSDLKVIQANPRFAELLRRPEREVVGMPLAAFVPPAQLIRVSQQFSELSAGTVNATESEIQAVRGDATFWLHWSATVVRTLDGQVDYFIAMLNDTTAKHEAEVAAVASFNVLERLNRLKSEFVTMVSHEFRTALVGIQGFSELMRDEQDLDVPTVRALASDIYDSTRQLDQMLDKMLDLGGSKSDQVGLHLVPVELCTLVRAAVAEANASGRTHLITLDLDQNLTVVSGDAVRLADVMNILLDNAIKYSPPDGEIRVSCHAQPGQVVVSVKDHGTGVSADFDERLFARYQWTANNPTTAVLGTGLGLPIARRIVEMHGGRIWFESEAGIGSEFHFSVPMWASIAGPAQASLPTPLTLAS